MVMRLISDMFHISVVTVNGALLLIRLLTGCHLTSREVHHWLTDEVCPDHASMSTRSVDSTKCWQVDDFTLRYVILDWAFVLECLHTERKINMAKEEFQTEYGSPPLLIVIWIDGGDYILTQLYLIYPVDKSYCYHCAWNHHCKPQRFKQIKTCTGTVRE